MSERKMTKAEIDARAAYLADHIRNVKTRLPLKSRVIMEEEALAMFPRYRGVRGTVVGYAHGTSPKVLWDGRKTVASYAPWFIRRVALSRHDRSGE
jgi:hypothetical protein